MTALRLLVATRKGLFVLASGDRGAWTIEGPHFLGHIVHHAVLDPRDGRTLLAAVRAGHLGPTLYRTEDLGASWSEAGRPPAFRKKPGGDGLVVGHVFWLAPAHRSEPARWYAGTSPQGLFVSTDAGRTWDGIDGFNENPQRAQWVGDSQAGPPGGATLHSINVAPDDARHLYIGMSGGGVFESLDGGQSWQPLNRGCAADFLPDPEAEYGHDPHCVRVHAESGDVYQQNHCGIYRLDRAARRWERIGRAMPPAIGDIGFPIVLHPRDPSTLWVFPMDGGTVWPRVSLDGKPAAYRSRDAGASWQRLDAGLPPTQAWFTVKRQAMSVDALDPVGVYFGTTSGEVWASADEGASWRCIAAHLPEIFAVEAAVA